MPGRYVPDRCDICWLDYEPKKGAEIGKYRPAFILSSKVYNKKTGLVICCPISTRITGHLSEVGIACLDEPSVIVTTMVHTLSWRDRNVKHISKATSELLSQVLARLLPLLGVEVVENL